LTKQLIEQNIAVRVSDSARKFLAKVGYDPIFGARPLRRTIQRMVENPISSLLIKQEVMSGDTILIDGDEMGLNFKVEKMQRIAQPAEAAKLGPDGKPVVEPAPKNTEGATPNPAAASPLTANAPTGSGSMINTGSYASPTQPVTPSPANPSGSTLPSSTPPSVNPPAGSPLSSYFGGSDEAPAPTPPSSEPPKPTATPVVATTSG
jgi:hypothetical protein